MAHVPAGLAATAAAPVICAGLTTYKGIEMTKARPGEWLVVSGTGGLGHPAIQDAKIMRLQVCAVDIDDGTLAHATRLGADLVVNASDGDPVWAVKKGTDGGAHGVLITAPSLDAFKQGVGMTRKPGTCALVGLPPGDQRDIPAPGARGRAVPRRHRFHALSGSLAGIFNFAHGTPRRRPMLCSGAGERLPNAVAGPGPNRLRRRLLRFRP